MKTRSWIVIVALVLGIGCGVVWWTAPKPAGDAGESASIATKTSAEKADPLSPASSALAAAQRQTTTGSPSLETNFDLEFGTSHLQRRQISDGLAAQHLEWLEQRGLAARVLSADGDALSLFIPGLVIGEKELREAALAALGKVVPRETAITIWDHPTGRKFIERELRLAWLGADSWYDLKRIQRRDPRLQPELADSVTFDAAVRRIPAKGAPSLNGPEDAIRLNMSFESIVSPYEIGWNAAAKAPPGYFRGEPILGVASRPVPPKRVRSSVDDSRPGLRELPYPGSLEIIKADGTAPRPGE